ncbi:MAG: nucleoside triphosphate pyrophosphohydrolase [Rhodanobacter sp.]
MEDAEVPGEADRNPRYSLDDLLEIMRALRDPGRGCPWDLQQDFRSLAAYTIEEAYEVVDAIDRGAWDDLRDELGDLLLQVVFHAQLASEAHLFKFDDVVHALSSKLRHRHPHVFGKTRYADAAEQKLAWEAIKAQERAGKQEQIDDSALAGIAKGLPESRRALKLLERAAQAGFDWPDAQPVLTKLLEEVDEVRAEFARGAEVERLEDEIGDVLFVLVNLTRHAGVDFAAALRHANAKFERRFRQMEQLARADGDCFSRCSLAVQEQLWQRVKAGESSA